MQSGVVIWRIGCTNYVIACLIHFTSILFHFKFSSFSRFSRSLAGLNVPSSHVAVSGCRRILLRSLSADFRRLVLGCMDSYDSEQRRLLLHFSRSTRFASFCTFLISEILQISINFFCFFLKFRKNSAILFEFCKNPRKSGNIREKNAKNLQILRLEWCKRMQIL